MLLYDKTNLKDVAQVFTTYMHRCGVEPSNMKAFFIELLAGGAGKFELTAEESKKWNRNSMEITEHMLQKYCSGQLSGGGILQPLADRISQGNIKGAYYDNVKRLVEKALATGSDEVFRLLLHNVDARYCEEEEFIALHDTAQERNYVEFFSLILRHVFASALGMVAPSVADRLYAQASAIVPGEIRWRIMKEGMLLDDSRCGIDYANRNKTGMEKNGSIEESDPYLEAFRIYSKHSLDDECLWNVGEYIVKDRVSIRDQELAIKNIFIDSRITNNLIKPNLVDLTHLNSVEPGDTDNPNGIVFAAKIFFMLANQKYPFPKAANSFARLLETNKLRVRENADITRDDLIDHYYMLAVRSCDLFGSLNYGARQAKKILYQNAAWSDYEIDRTTKLLELGLEVQWPASIYYYSLLSEYLIGQQRSKISLAEIKAQYRLLLEREDDNPYRGKAAYRLAVLSMDTVEMESLLQVAIESGVTDAVYRLVMLRYERLIREENPSMLINTITILETKIHLLSGSEGKECEQLLKKLKKMATKINE